MGTCVWRPQAARQEDRAQRTHWGAGQEDPRWAPALGGLVSPPTPVERRHTQRVCPGCFLGLEFWDPRDLL